MQSVEILCKKSLATGGRPPGNPLQGISGQIASKTLEIIGAGTTAMRIAACRIISGNGFDLAVNRFRIDNAFKIQAPFGLEPEKAERIIRAEDQGARVEYAP